MVLLLLRFPGHDQLAAALFIVFSMTDIVDGEIARRRGTVSNFGKFLDPLADKLFVLSVLIVLVQEGLVAAWVVVVIFSRELVITILRAVGASQGQVIAAAPLGKTKTWMQMIAVTLLILQRPYPVVVPLADVAVGVAVVFTLWSGLDYLWRFRYLIGQVDSSQAPTRTGPAGGAPGQGGASGAGFARPDVLRGDVPPQTDETVDAAARELSEVLRKARFTVAVAESCTGGLLEKLITDQPGSSAYFLGGVIAYADEVKRDQLGVPAGLLKSFGAVSREVAEAMAEGVRSRFGTDLAVAVTGIAGPDADGSGKPVGLTYIAVASGAGTASHEYNFSGDRWSNRRDAARHALKLLVEEARTGDQTRQRTA